MSTPQKTIGQTVERQGVGVNLGRKVLIRLLPAPPDQGLVFLRTDLEGSPAIPVLPDRVGQEPRRTVLRQQGAEVQMTEHLLAAVAAFDIDNLTIELNGPELPVGDGSARLFAEMVHEAGIVEQDAARAERRLQEPIIIADGEATLEARPAAEGLTIAYRLAYGEGPVKPQTFEIRVRPDSFVSELASARTFVFEKEAAHLIASGFGRGATPENTLVIRADGSLLGNELRFPNEFARHKVLDLLGDLRLAGPGLRVHIRAERSGHAHNLQLARRLFEQFQTSS